MLTKADVKHYDRDVKNLSRQSPYCSYGTITNSANIPMRKRGYHKLQCTISVRIGAVVLERPLTPLGLFTSVKRNQPPIISRRLNMGKSDTISVSTETLSKITDSIGTVAASISGLSQLLQCGETSNDRLEMMLEVFSNVLHDDYDKLNKIVYGEV
jgi:hypothetical protein